MKKLFAIAALAMFSTWAQARDITLDLPFKPGGFAGDMSTMLSKDLNARGWNVKVVMSGNCAVSKRNMSSAKEPVATFWHNRFHLLTNPECAMSLPTATDFVATMYRGSEFLCRVNKKPGPVVDWTQETGTVRLSIQEFPFQIDEMVSYLKRNTRATVKTIVYKNSGAQSAAAAAGEVDYVIGAVGPKLESNNLATCQYTTDLKPNGKSRAMKDHFVGISVYSPSMQYMKAINLSPQEMEKLRRDVRESLQQDHWKTWSGSRGLSLDLDMNKDQQLKTVQDSVKPFMK